MSRCIKRKPSSRWAFQTYRYAHVACWFRWKWQARLHAVWHLEPGYVENAADHGARMLEERKRELQILKMMRTW